MKTNLQTGREMFIGIEWNKEYEEEFVTNKG